MSAKAQMQLLHAGSERQINIFIHGYGAIESANRLLTLHQCILQARPRGRVYLLYWKSGDWRTPLWLKVAHRAYAVAKAARLSPWALAGDAIATSILTAAHFKYYEMRAEKLGRSLKHHVARLPNSRRYPISLIGHSLGARVIHYALDLDWSNYRMQHCVLLGGAADAETDDWDDCVSKISGRLYNVYSPDDAVLKYFTIKRRVGSGPIAAKSSRIINMCCPGLGHNDYWTKLGDILPALWSPHRASPRGRKDGARVANGQIQLAEVRGGTKQGRPRE